MGVRVLIFEHHGPLINRMDMEGKPYEGDRVLEIDSFTVT